MTNTEYKNLVFQVLEKLNDYSEHKIFSDSDVIDFFKKSIYEIRLDLFHNKLRNTLLVAEEDVFNSTPEALIELDKLLDSYPVCLLCSKNMLNKFELIMKHGYFYDC